MTDITFLKPPTDLLKASRRVASKNAQPTPLAPSSLPSTQQLGQGVPLPTGLSSSSNPSSSAQPRSSPPPPPPPPSIPPPHRHPDLESAWLAENEPTLDEILRAGEEPAAHDEPDRNLDGEVGVQPSIEAKFLARVRDEVVAEEKEKPDRWPRNYRTGSFWQRGRDPFFVLREESSEFKAERAPGFAGVEAAGFHRDVFV